MVKSLPLPSPDQMKITQMHQARRKIIDKVWSILVIVALLTLIGYSIVIQISHHL
jgi:hypothetical protein